MAEGESDAGSTAVAAAGRIKRFVRPVLGVIAAAFVVATAWNLVASWESARIDVQPALAVLAALPLVLSCIAQGIGWIALVERMANTKTPRLDALSLYLASQLARYTPGKVGLPLVRVEGAPRIGLARGLVGISVLIEALSWTATGAVLGFLLIALTAEQAAGGVLEKFSWPLVAGSVFGGALLTTLDRSRYPAAIRRILAPDGEGPLVPRRLPAIQLGYWALVAVHGYLLSTALGASHSSALSAMGFYVLASVAGFVVLAAPAGLGVREAVLVAGLAPSIGSAAALGAAAFSRVLWLVTEIVTWILTRALARKYGLRASP
ncbi:MAG TPA: lysylphosphatidylglycerol synthase domain-containing protein [Polyangiaceae bacterium]